LLYDVTSTYFEGQAGGDCKQVCIGLVVTREGIPLGYEVFAGNRADGCSPIFWCALRPDRTQAALLDRLTPRTTFGNWFSPFNRRQFEHHQLGGRRRQGFPRPFRSPHRAGLLSISVRRLRT
jgi:hypothetical protein